MGKNKETRQSITKQRKRKERRHGALKIEMPESRNKRLQPVHPVDGTRQTDNSNSTNAPFEHRALEKNLSRIRKYPSRPGTWTIGVHCRIEKSCVHWQEEGSRPWQRKTTRQNP